MARVSAGILLALLALGSAALHTYAQDTIASVASGVPDLSILVSVVGLCPPILAAVTDPNTEVTVFAPNNQAFLTAIQNLGLSPDSLLNSQDLICGILQAHIVPSIIPSSAATATPISVPTLLPGFNVTIFRAADGTVMVNEARVLAADVPAGKSVVHIISAVLLPPSLIALLPPSMEVSPSPSPPDAPTIASVASSIPELAALVSLIGACPDLLAAATNPNTTVTVFAPSNQAFSSVAADLQELIGTGPDVLCEILSYHIVPVVVKAADVPTIATSVPTLLPGSNLTVEQNAGSVTVNDATVVTADIIAGLSVIHIVNKVLVPASLRPNATSESIVSVISAIPDLSILTAAVAACPPLFSAANNSGTTVTLFAPTNEAFSAALLSLNIAAEDLLGDEELLCSVLSYHVVAYPVYAISVPETQTLLPSLLPGYYLLAERNLTNVTVNDASVTTADIPASFSVVHVIDKVLLPSLLFPNTTIASTVEPIQQLSTFYAVAQYCPAILAAGTNPNVTLTVFAPTNEAIAQALLALNVTADELVSDEELLCSVLTYHVLSYPVYSKDIANLTNPVVGTLNGADVSIRTFNDFVSVNTAYVTLADITAGKSVVHIIDDVLLPPSLRDSTIASVASSQPQFSALVAALAYCPDLLAAVSDSNTSVTLFAPTNEAVNITLKLINESLESLLNDTDTLCAILSYHVVDDIIKAVAVPTDATELPTLLNSTNVTIVRDTTGNVVVNNAKVVTADVVAGISIVHAIDRMLLPPALSPNTTIAGIASGVPELSTLLAAVSLCPDLLDAASDSETSVTLFAPTNSAFSDLLEQLNVTSALEIDNSLLCGILSYHLSPSIYFFDDIPSSQILVPSLLDGAILLLEKNSTTAIITVNNATVITPDVRAGWSLVHVIDQVLLPSHLLPNATIASGLTPIKELSTLLSAISECPSLLEAVTNPATAVTIFAPTDQAFALALVELNLTAEELFADQETLCSLLSYHIIGAVINSADLPLTPIEAPALSGGSLAINKTTNSFEVNNVTVTFADIKAGLSVVNIIDRVLTPPPEAPVETIASVAASVDMLSTLVAAVSNCPSILAAASDPYTAVTLFAPTNNAFNAALAALNVTATDLLSDETLLCSILSYHIVRAKILAADVPVNATEIPTWFNNEPITVSKIGGVVVVNNAKVLAADIIAGLSIVHIIDHVLLPSYVKDLLPTIAGAAAGVPDLSTLLTVVSASPSILAAATNPLTEVTVFAPNNAAFEAGLPALTAALNITTEQLLASPRVLTAILQYHISPSIIPSNIIRTSPISVPTLLRQNLSARRVGSSVLINNANVVVPDVAVGYSLVHVIDQVLLPPNWEALLKPLL